MSLAFSRDGTTMASSAGDCTVRIWDVKERRERFSIPGTDRAFGALAITPDGRLLALADRVSPLVRMWDLTSETENAPLAGARGPVVAVAISPDGSTLAAADLQGFVTFWNVSTHLIRPNSHQPQRGLRPGLRARRPRSCNRWLRRHDSPLGLSDRGSEIVSASTNR